MASEIKYEYRMSWVYNKPNKVDESLREWAQAGWELVSGSVATKLEGTIFAMYWRRPL